MKPSTPEEFVRDRDAALLSMDREVIRAYQRKYNIRLPFEDGDLFWIEIHKARTAARTLPMEARSESKRYLLSVGSRPLDDGDVPI